MKNPAEDLSINRIPTFPSKTLGLRTMGYEREAILQSWDENTSSFFTNFNASRSDGWHYDKPALRQRSTTSKIVPGKDEEPKTVRGNIYRS